MHISYSLLVSPSKHRTYFMRFHQHKGSRTAFLRRPIVHFALATGFLALQPGRFLDENGVPHKPLSLSGHFQDIMHGVILPSSVHNIRKSKSTHLHHPTKVQPSWSSPKQNNTVCGTVAASLISVGVGAALALGRSSAQGNNSSSGEGDSGNNGSDNTINGDSGRNSLGKLPFFSFSPISDLAFTAGEGSPPGDSPNDPPVVRNNVGRSHFTESRNSTHGQ